MSEPLYTCPLCKRHGFTRTGIHSHCCRALPKVQIKGVISRDAPTGSIITPHQRLPADLVDSILGRGIETNQPTSKP